MDFLFFSSFSELPLLCARGRLSCVEMVCCLSSDHLLGETVGFLQLQEIPAVMWDSICEYSFFVFYSLLCLVSLPPPHSFVSKLFRHSVFLCAFWVLRLQHQQQQQQQPPQKLQHRKETGVGREGKEEEREECRIIFILISKMQNQILVKGERKGGYTKEIRSLKGELGLNLVLESRNLVYYRCPLHLNPRFPQNCT